MAIKAGEDIQCNKDVVLEESREDKVVGSGVTAMDWLVKEREIEVPNMEKSRQYYKNIVLGRDEAEKAR